jgi:hypothetical protein
VVTGLTDTLKRNMTKGTGEGLLDLDLMSPEKTYSGLAVGALSPDATQAATTYQFRSRWEQQPHLENIDLQAIGAIASRRKKLEPNAMVVVEAEHPARDSATRARRRSIIGAVVGAVVILVIGSFTLRSGHATAKVLHSADQTGKFYFAQPPNMSDASAQSPEPNTTPTASSTGPVAALSPPDSQRQGGAPVVARAPAPVRAPSPTSAPPHPQGGSPATPAPPPPTQRSTPAPTPPPVLSGPYSGYTSRGQAVSFTVSGSTVTNILFVWTAVCSNGQSHSNTISAGSATLRGNSFTLTAAFPSSPTTLAVTFRGVISGRSAYGTFSRSGGSSFDTNCSASGSWTASLQ